MKISLDVHNRIEATFNKCLLWLYLEQLAVNRGVHQCGCCCASTCQLETIPSHWASLAQRWDVWCSLLVKPNCIQLQEQMRCHTRLYMHACSIISYHETEVHTRTRIVKEDDLIAKDIVYLDQLLGPLQREHCLKMELEWFLESIWSHKASLRALLASFPQTCAQSELTPWLKT